jgi:hypothetical protein
MRYNKWTIVLATLGLVTLDTVARAGEQPASAVTSLAPTTLSGFVDTSAQWNFGTGNANNPPYRFGGPDKADGFNLNAVQVRLEKGLDDTLWSAGYRLDLWAGPDASTLGTQSTLATGSSDFAIRQAYVLLQAPVGNGIHWKMGVFDSIIGYESVESASNPNFTRSYGHTIEPNTHTGLLASYRFSETLSASAGVANTQGPAINSRATDGSTGQTSGLWSHFFPGSTFASAGENAYAESYKTYMGSVALTAPESTGFLAGSTLYGGVVNGFNNSVLGSGAGMPQLSLYGGATIATPVAGLRLGVAFDETDLHTTYEGTSVGGSVWTLAGYASYQLTEKLSFHARGEYLDYRLDEPASNPDHINALALTGTVQYDLWQNVLSRLEFRWDRSLSAAKLFGGETAGEPNARNAFLLVANIVYRF